MVSLQLPFADLRAFLSHTGKLYRPAWPTPEPDDEFVRSYGNVQTRWGGGLRGWVGENEVARADRGIRFDGQIPSYVSPHSNLRVPLQCAFRRLFFDGLAVGKCEIGLNTRVYRKTMLDLKDASETRDFLQHVLNIRVNVKNPLEQEKSRELGGAGKLIARSYASVTTGTSGGHPKVMPVEGWVLAGQPLQFIVIRKGEHVPWPYPLKPVTIPEEYHFELGYCLVPFAGRRIPAWVLKIRSEGEPSSARTLRLYLLRLHAEHECLRLVLRGVDDGSIDVTTGLGEADALQRYINVSTQHIWRWESKAEALISDNFNYGTIAEIARSSEDQINPGRRDALLERLQQVRVRKNILRKVEEYTGQSQDTPNRQTIIQNYYWEVKHMGDRIDISGNVGSFVNRSPRAVVKDFEAKFVTRDGSDRDKVNAELVQLVDLILNSKDLADQDKDKTVRAVETVAEQVKEGKADELTVSGTLEKVQDIVSKATDIAGPAIKIIAAVIALL